MWAFLMRLIERMQPKRKKCLHLDCQATNIFYQSMKDNIFGEIMDMKSVHEKYCYLNDFKSLAGNMSSFKV